MAEQLVDALREENATLRAEVQKWRTVDFLVCAIHALNIVAMRQKDWQFVGAVTAGTWIGALCKEGLMSVGEAREALGLEEE